MTHADGMLVSIIIPVYDTEQYLERCVKSVRGQSYSNLEIILVDDGSPDRCPEMCDALARADSRISVIHQENAGQGVARNAALDVLSGDYIMFVDSDDYIQPEMVQELVSVAHEDSADLVLCGYSRFNGIRTVDLCFRNSRVQFDNESLMREYYFDEEVNGMLWAKLFRRHLFHGMRFPPIRFREDSFIMHEILGRVGAATFIPKPLYVYFTREGSTEQGSLDLARLNTVLEVEERLLEYTGRHYPELIKHAHYHKAVNLSSLMRGIRTGPWRRSQQSVFRTLQSQLQEELAKLGGFSPKRDAPLLRHAANDDLVFRLYCLRSVAGRKIRRLRSRLHTLRTQWSGQARSGDDPGA